MGRRESQSQRVPGPENRSLGFSLVLKLLHLVADNETQPGHQFLWTDSVFRHHQNDRSGAPNPAVLTLTPRVPVVTSLLLILLHRKSGKSTSTDIMGPELLISHLAVCRKAVHL